MPSQSDLRSQITTKIVEALENSGIPPWRCPWIKQGLPTNVISHRRYSGVNVILLQMASMRHGFTSKFFGTFRQWQELGCTIKKRPDDVQPGQWGTNIVFFKPIKKTKIDDDTGEEEQIEFGLLKNYTVFNLDQAEGKKADELRDIQVNERTGPNYEAAERLIEGSGAEIHFGGDQACYHRPLPEGSWPNHSSGDFILMPHRSAFNKSGAFYETLLHELAHFSEVRIGWNHVEQGYAAGELVAELTATYLASELGIPHCEEIDNHAAYVGHWLAAMKGDSSYVFRAASQASKTTDFLLSFIREPAIIV